MKKINKSLPPNPLTLFAANQPAANWENFRNHGVLGQAAGADYKATKKLIFDDQGELCAYCEEKTPHTQPDKQRLEHFHSKSDKTNPQKNWALDWGNIFGVCLGGSDSSRSIKRQDKNLSCDSHKDHLLTKAEQNNCEGLYVNPLHLHAFPCLFEFNKRTGELTAHAANCQKVTFSVNQHASTEALVTKTIEVFNLNCKRLTDNRIKVFAELERLKKKAHLAGKKNNVFMQELTQIWLKSAPYQNFFTTRRILLGQHAETHLRTIGYNG